MSRVHRLTTIPELYPRMGRAVSTFRYAHHDSGEIVVGDNSFSISLDPLQLGKGLTSCYPTGIAYSKEMS